MRSFRKNIVHISATAFVVALLFFAGTVYAQDFDEDTLDEFSLDAYGHPIITQSINLPGASATSEGVPRIIPRSTWENTDELKKLFSWTPEENHTPPDYSAIDTVIVHDLGCSSSSPTCNSDSVNPVSLIQNIYRFHAITRGWGDLGYNFVIDRQGRIYEGRFGGNGSRAAHTYVSARCENFNIGSVGILLLGNYSTSGAQMPFAMQDSLARLAGWLGAVNGFDPAGVAAIKIWKNQKISAGTCDISVGDFSGTYSGYRFISHGDIEPGNSDKFDLSSIRVGAKTFSDSFRTFYYQADSGNKKFAIANGILSEIADTGTAKIASIPFTQINLFPSHIGPKFADGTLVKSYTRDSVYRIEGGKKRSIPTATLFNSLGYAWENIKTVSDRDLAFYSSGTAMPFPDGTLVKGSGSEVYRFEGGLVRHITAASLFSALKLDWKKIVTIPNGDMESYGRGNPYLLATGTLIRGSGPRIYFVEGTMRRPISSGVLFAKLKYKWTAVKQIGDRELDYYALGPYVVWPTGTLLTAKESGKVWYIHNGFKRWIQSADVFRTLGLSWKNVQAVAQEEIDGYKEAQAVAKKSDINIRPQALASATVPPAPSGTTVVPQPTVANEPTIRIGIYSPGAGEQVGISVNSSYTIARSGLPSEDKPADTTVSFTPGKDMIIRIVPNDANGIITLNSYTDLAYNGSNDNRFRGKVEIAYSNASQKFWVINELPLEAYIKGVAETVNDDPIEHNKTFAIAARSYALYYIQQGSKTAGEIFHLGRTPGDQLYKGYNFELRAKNPVQAAIVTRGLVATFNGKPILAAYSSGAAGQTKNACTVWGGKFCEAPFAYLAGGVDDPADTQYKTSCGGSNHCIGLDAAGSRRMATLGNSAETILKKYYPGIVVSQQYQ